MQQHNASNSTHWTPTVNVAPCILLALCSLVGIPGNLLVIVAILRNIRQATMTVRLMLNLAFTDLLSLLLVVPWIPALLGDWPYNEAFCKLFSYALYCCVYMSVLTVTAMSMQRYIQVAYPLRLRTWKKKSTLLLGGLWLLALLLSSPTMFLRKLVLDNGRLRCQPWYNSNTELVALLMLETVVGFVVPSVLIGISYANVIHRVKKMPFTTSRRLRLNRLVIWVVAAFLALWFPSHVANILHVCATLAPSGSTALRSSGEHLRNLAGALTFFNSCLNPFLYALASRNLRGSSSLLKKMERVWDSRQPDTPPTDSRKPSLCTQSNLLVVPKDTPGMRRAHTPEE
ncbi:leukotriene B4 receptor 1-like [Paramormyrops kingsleyae]|uniref:Leukotriene B4 receptor 1-like n=1 Tax=Paramormyrops kingsleyae TaxID=1676925 RepID=A0A3B3R7Z1_9TELE|nr:leukotriene B4 receptor 1-like [Paramormyrops kingsleyae]